eukprot:Gregarina_sp_Poly_1__10081@NODE_680_length_6809_cov_177_847375_g513_i0_p7_GENE_NODE_680_length_6809_cov_177_847375_g513_i0NODE_680_length_6809_cov_177_847375_g513_i0_p7_ORF_typecomplete_len123_score2_92_NODE_680_length_6809_cov_177_847375_g513_i062736641
MFIVHLIYYDMGVFTSALSLVLRGALGQINPNSKAFIRKASFPMKKTSSPISYSGAQTNLAEASRTRQLLVNASQSSRSALLFREITVCVRLALLRSRHVLYRCREFWLYIQSDWFTIHSYG